MAKKKVDTSDSVSKEHGAEIHPAFAEHAHLTKVWVDEATGEWYIHPKKGCLLVEKN